MLTRAFLAEQVSDYLARLKSKINIMSRQGLYDVNNYAQDIICRLYNAAYDYRLVNLNKEKTTVEGIDLGDKQNRVAVQVTSENTSGKIKETIRIFNEKELYKEYDRLIIALLVDKKKYTATFDTKGFFTFSVQNDIIDLSDLALYVKNCSLEKQQKIVDILLEEFEYKSTFVFSNIETLEKQITARCRSKLISIGVTETLADKIIEEDINSNRFADILEAERQGKLYLQGEYGSGKTHALLILFLRMLREYRIDKHKPLPLYVTASEIIKLGGIQAWKEKQESAEAFFIFIDGCDEMSVSEAEKVLNEVHYLRSLWDNVRFLLSGRHLPIFPDQKYIHNISCLSEERTIELISMVSGKGKDNVHSRFFSMEEGIKKTLRFPLFSLLYGVLMNQAGEYFYPSYSQLISSFIDKTLKGELEKDEIVITLEKIAILSVDRNLGKVHVSEIRGDNIHRVLQHTGFLFLHLDNTVSFSLPIIAQWFAADGIIHKAVSIDDILDDAMRSSRWRYAFSLMFSRMTFEESLEIFSKIIFRDIGSAAMIINNGTINEYMEVTDSSLECGKKIRKCMGIWAEALGELKHVLTPYKGASLKNLAIYADGCQVTTTWSEKPDTDDVCVLNPIEQIRWLSVTETRGIHLQATWPWIYTFETIQRNLQDIIKYRSVLCENEDILKEYVWKQTLSLLNKGNLCQENISLKKIEKYRKYQNSILYVGRKEYRLNTFFTIVDKMYSSGVYSVCPSVPGGDKEFGEQCYVWGNYSEHRLYERVSIIYKKALEAYSDYISSWFSSFAPRMKMAVLMPGILHVNLIFKEEGEDYQNGPILSWHMEAQPQTTTNTTAITLNQPEDWHNDHNLLHSILGKDIEYRPSQREWLVPSLRVKDLRCFDATPITDVVFEWIEDDLKEIEWI